MAHPRKLIRQAVVAQLVGATAAGARVQATRVEPHKRSQLPAISVYTLTDSVDEDSESSLEVVHELELEIAGWVAASDAKPVDDAMDDLAEEIERAMRVDPYLGGKAGDVRLTGTTMEVVEDNGRNDPVVGIVILTYAVEYRTERGVSTADLDDFRRVRATYEIYGVDDDNVADDAFVVQGDPPEPDPDPEEPTP